MGAWLEKLDDGTQRLGEREAQVGKGLALSRTSDSREMGIHGLV